MKPLQIFRIEDRYGNGFYKSGVSRDIMDDYCDRAAHPMPDQDSLYADARFRHIVRFPHWDRLSHLFGFVSIEQLRRWFYNDVWIKRMSECKMVVCVYETDPAHTLVGRAQLTFPQESRCILRFDPAWLLEL